VTGPWPAQHRGADLALRGREVHSAYESFLSGEAFRSPVRPLVLDSWRRSLRNGVDPDAGAAMVVLDTDALGRHRAEHPLAAVLPMVRSLLVRDAAELGLLVAVSDAHGRLLWVEGDARLRDRATGMHFVEGADWSERAAGTNAPGTALALDRSVQIFEAEHFARTVQRWSCSAAPVHDPDTGELLGAIDVTGGDHVAAPHILALVRATVAAIEAELRLHRLRFASSPRPGAHLSVLGRQRPMLHRDGVGVALSLRHAEILLLLSERPEGATAEELAVQLAEHELNAVTVRAEVSRLRRIVGTALIGSRPYRLTQRLHSDVQQVRGMLAQGNRPAAVRLCRGPVLPGSQAPGVVELRAELWSEIRTSLLRAPDAQLLLECVELPQGRDDAALLRACSTALPTRSPQADHVLARLAVLTARYA